MVLKTLFALAGLIAALMLYIRLAPSDPMRWHVNPPSSSKRFAQGLVEVIPGDRALFARLAEIAAATPRTSLLAGNASEGHLTYVTRSRLWGFPDYTTIALTDAGQIIIFARLRFGRSDIGVNAARVQGWLKRLQAVQG